MKIGISAGDPAGIGLEVVVKSLPKVLQDACWIVYTGRADFVGTVERYAGSLAWREWTAQTTPEPGVVYAAFLDGIGSPVTAGKPGPESGRRALRALEAAGHAALGRRIDGIVTAPLSKSWVGGEFRGQTDYLAAQSGVTRVAMAFFTPTFKVVLVTTHLSLRESIDRLTIERYTDLLDLTVSELRSYGLPEPRIAVAALNPHAGEGGMFGSEDDQILAPAVEAARRSGLDVSGPHSADSLYHRAHQGEFDVVIAPYHDQGLIPVKLIAPRSAANVTLGLPYVRTSPDHGTAFDIAGMDVADPHGMETAMRWALRLIKADRR